MERNNNECFLQFLKKIIDNVQIGGELDGSLILDTVSFRERKAAKKSKC